MLKVVLTFLESIAGMSAMRANVWVLIFFIASSFADDSNGELLVDRYLFEVRR